MALAPMANVTDEAFRQMFAQCGGPDVFWTEFVSVEGLLSKGREKLLVDFWFERNEHPIVAQIFGGKPEQFEEVGALINKLGFDGIDINMGCPDRGVERSGAGASLIKNPKLAKEIIRATIRGAGKLPVSVKTRIGYNKNELAEWVPALLEENIAALTMHLRTRKEMSDVPAHWDLATELVSLRDSLAPDTLIIGNGDISSLEDARTKTKTYGVDGVMVATGAFGNPWFFSGKTPDIHERLTRLVAHAELFQNLYKCDIPKKDGGCLKNFDVMKKHFKAYVGGFDDSKELRIRLMETNNAEQVQKIVEEFLQN